MTGVQTCALPICGKVHKIFGHTRGRNVNVSWFVVTRTPEDAPKTPEDAPVVFCRYDLVGPVRGPRQCFLRPKSFVPAPVPRELINSPLVLKIPQSEKHKCGEPNFSRASRRHRNRLYRSLHPKVAARRKVHKISGHTRTKC